MASLSDKQTGLADPEIYILTLQPVPVLSPVIRLEEQETDCTGREERLSRWQIKLHCLSTGVTVVLRQFEDLPPLLYQEIQSRQFRERPSLR